MEVNRNMQALGGNCSLNKLQHLKWVGDLFLS